MLARQGRIPSFKLEKDNYQKLNEFSWLREIQKTDPYFFLEKNIEHSSLKGFELLDSQGNSNFEKKLQIETFNDELKTEAFMVRLFVWIIRFSTSQSDE